jgi:inosine-uridine nucleoside N-ribohydrolase
MGGHIYEPRKGFAQWENGTDFNLQVDVTSARHVIANSDATLVPLTVTVETALRKAYLPELRKAGRLGELIAQQAEAFEIDEQDPSRHSKLSEKVPKDIINFQHDPLACAIALGWDEGVEIEVLPLALEIEDGELFERVRDGGKPTRVVTKVDGGRFSEFWLERVTAYV